MSVIVIVLAAASSSKQLVVTLGDPFTIAGFKLYGWQARRCGEVVRWGNVRATTKESATRAAKRSARLADRQSDNAGAA